MMKEKYYEAGEILTGLIHPKGEVTNDKLTGAAEELQRNNLLFWKMPCPLVFTGAEAYVPKGIG